MNTEYAIYLISNFFHTIVIYRFMRVLFGEDKAIKTLGLISYLAFFVITSIVFYLRQAPLYNLIATTVALLVIAFNYKTTLKSKIMSVVFIYSFSIISEVLAISVLRLLGFIRTPFPFIGNEIIIGRISSEIILFLCVLLFSNFKIKKTNTEISLLYWVAVIAVPLMTLFPAIFIIHDTKQDFRIMLFTQCQQANQP